MQGSRHEPGRNSNFRFIPGLSESLSTLILQGYLFGSSNLTVQSARIAQADPGKVP